MSKNKLGVPLLLQNPNIVFVFSCCHF